jgi:hypothetical protein
LSPLETLSIIDDKIQYLVDFVKLLGVIVVLLVIGNTDFPEPIGMGKKGMIKNL